MLKLLKSGSNLSNALLEPRRIVVNHRLPGMIVIRDQLNVWWNHISQEDDWAQTAQQGCIHRGQEGLEVASTVEDSEVCEDREVCTDTATRPFTLFYFSFMTDSSCHWTNYHSQIKIQLETINIFFNSSNRIMVLLLNFGLKFDPNISIYTFQFLKCQFINSSPFQQRLLTPFPYQSALILITRPLIDN